MTAAIWSAAAFCALTLGIHLVSTLVAIVRCRRHVGAIEAPPGMPPVTIVRPVCGIENFVEETLRSAFRLAYPRYELIMCAASAHDPVVPLVRRLIADHPHVDARLLIGDERVSDNPKLNNCVKGWNTASSDWIVIADSNVLMPRDYVQRLMARWRASTGLVCAPPIGTWPKGFWAELECAFLNTHQARWQYFADTLGVGFAQGKSMLWRRADLELAGGIRALGDDVAEDAASTKVVRAAGLAVHLVDTPFPQPLGQRSWGEMWHRQSRWARLRRACFPHFFMPEILCGALWPAAAAGLVADAAGLPVIPCVLSLAAIWYGAEAALAHTAGWPLTIRYPVHAAVRDLLMPLLWVDGWIGSTFVWRGNAMTVGSNRTVSDGKAA